MTTVGPPLWAISMLPTSSFFFAMIRTSCWFWFQKNADGDSRRPPAMQARVTAGCAHGTGPGQTGTRRPCGNVERRRAGNIGFNGLRIVDAIRGPLQNVVLLVSGGPSQDMPLVVISGLSSRRKELLSSGCVPARYSSTSKYLSPSPSVLEDRTSSQALIPMLHQSGRPSASLSSSTSQMNVRPAAPPFSLTTTNPWAPDSVAVKARCSSPPAPTASMLAAASLREA